MTRAWTLGYPPSYDKAILVPGNAKAPGGYIFPTREAAEEHAWTHDDASRYGAYEVELPGAYEDCATRDWRVAHEARHAWHQTDDPTGRDPAVDFITACAVCNPEHRLMMEQRAADHDLLTVQAPFVVPE